MEAHSLRMESETRDGGSTIAGDILSGVVVSEVGLEGRQPLSSHSRAPFTLGVKSKGEGYWELGTPTRCTLPTRWALQLQGSWIPTAPRGGLG